MTRRADLLSGKLLQLQEKLGMMHQRQSAANLDTAANNSLLPPQPDPSGAPTRITPTRTRNLSPSGFSSSSSATQMPLPPPPPAPQLLPFLTSDVVGAGENDNHSREETLKRLQEQLDIQKELEGKRKELEALLRSQASGIGVGSPPGPPPPLLDQDEPNNASSSSAKSSPAKMQHLQQVRPLPQFDSV